ncbi:MAG: HNH endonuclease signature motif containing protein [Planctomycetota bacterium]|jgi:hypothetical protein
MKRKGKIPEPVIDRWRRFADCRDGMSMCWPWAGARDKRGYGKLRVGSTIDGSRRSEYAHRLAYMLFVGPVADGLVVRHRCDHPWCVNPSHLDVGTHADNVHDAQDRGRHVPPPTFHNEEHPRAKLTMVLAAEMRRAIRSKHLTYEKAEAFYGVSKSTVCRVMSGKAWV